MRKGFVLITVVVLVALFLAMSLMLSRMIYANYSFSNAQVKSLQALCLSEAGVERAKTEIVKNPAWYTDLTSGPINKKWLIYHALGKIVDYGEGQFKIVRLKGKSDLYSVGYFSRARSIIKITFQAEPYRTLSWEQL